MGLDTVFAAVAIPFVLISSIAVYLNDREPKEPKEPKIVKTA